MAQIPQYDYMYPNWKSYVSHGRGDAPGGRSRLLEHGYICAVHTRTVGNAPDPEFDLPNLPDLTNPGTRPAQREVNYTLAKRFQFNPSAINLNLPFVPADMPGTETSGGGDSNAYAVGLATTKIDLMFDRSQEVYAASAGRPSKQLAVFRDIGVQKDIFDVFRVILGDNGDSFGDTGNTDLLDSPVGKMRPQSVTSLTNKMFDQVAQGSQIVGGQIIVVFNTNLAITGQVTGVDIAYIKFNNELVPLTATMSLGVMIFESNTARASTAPTGFGPATITTGARIGAGLL